MRKHNSWDNKDKDEALFDQEDIFEEELGMDLDTEIQVDKTDKKEEDSPKTALVRTPSIRQFKLDEDLVFEEEEEKEDLLDATDLKTDEQNEDETVIRQAPDLRPRSSRPPKAQVIRGKRQMDPLGSTEIGSRDITVKTPVPRVDEILPKQELPEEVDETKIPKAISQKDRTKQQKANKKIARSKKPKVKTAQRQANRFTIDKRFFTMRTAGILLLVSACLELLLIMLWSRIPDGLYGLDKTGFSGNILATVLTQLLLVLIPSVLIVALFRLPTSEIVGTEKMSFGLGLLSFAIGIPAGLFFHALNNVFMFILTQMDILLPEANRNTFVMPEEPSLLPILLIATVLAPAVFEELMFRGIVLPQMAKSGLIRSSLLIQALAFALFHDDPLFFIAPLGAGIILGFLRLKSASIYPSILAHISMNLSILFISPLLPRLSAYLILSLGSSSNLFFSANLIVAIVMGLLLMPLFALLSNMTALPVDLFSDKEEEKTPRRKRIFFISSAKEPSHFDKTLNSPSASPYLDPFLFVALLIFLLILLGNYYISL